MGDNLAEKIQEGLLDIPGEPVIEKLEGDQMTISQQGGDRAVVNLATRTVESTNPELKQSIEGIINAPEDSVYALLVQEFVDENKSFGVALVGQKAGVATISFRGGTVKVNLQTGEVDHGKIKPDAPAVVKLKSKLAQTPIPTDPISIVPVTGAIDQQAALTVDDVINYINPKATKAEAWMFLQYCRSMGLNPLARDVHLVVFEGEQGRQCNFIAGKESFAKRAEANSNYDGFKAGIIVKRPDGSLDYREGTFTIDDERLIGGWAEVFRKDRKEVFKAAVSLKDYDTGKSVWKTKKATMIRKVAYVQAHREAFPGALGGMYDQSEISEA